MYRQNGKVHTEEITDAEARPGGTRLTVAVSAGPERTFDVGADGMTWRTAGHFAMDARMARLPLRAGDS